MFATIGIALLLVARALHPQALLVALAPLPIVPLLVALALFGLVVDLKLRRSQLVAAPQLAWALALAAAILVDLLVRRPPGARADAAELGVGFILFLLVGEGVQSFRALRQIAATLLLLALGAAAVALLPSSPLGLVVDDPDALGLALALALPLAFALYEERPVAARLLLSIVTLLAVGLCVIFTRSRAGQLAASAVLTVHFVTRLRLRGLVVAALLAAPLFVFGARSWAGAPLFAHGLGVAAIVALAATAAILYLSFKIAVVVLDRYSDDADAAVARVWARALVAALAGLTAGLAFVPPDRHALFWIYTGLAGALYQAARAHDPQLGPVLIRRSRE